jgi:adenylate cyclase
MASAGSELHGGEPPNLTTPCPGDVLQQLERILASEEFSLPERGRKFLRYVVEETLAGGADRIKGYSIALQVFGRSDSFDAQSDPAVRIEAGRLRRALERYYLVAGQHDPIIINIPKGAYVPFFEQRTDPLVEAAVPAALPAKRQAHHRYRWPTQLFVGIGGVVLVSLALLAATLVWPSGLTNGAGPSAPDEPKLLVLPFLDTSGTHEGKVYAAGFADEIIAQLSAFKELTILGSETSRPAGAEPDIARLTAQLGARYLVRGSVRISGGQVRVTAHALETKTQAVLWSHTFSDDASRRDLIKMQEEVARRVAVAVGQPYGVIFQADSRRASRDVPSDLEAYFCTLRFYAYRAELSVAQHRSVRDCLEQAVIRWPRFATAWAMLSLLYVDEDRFGFNAKAQQPAIPRALEAARKAVAIEPDNIRALQSLMLALFFNHNPSEAISVGERALALNPNDPEFRGEFGSRIGIAGDWKRGSELLDSAMALRLGNSDYYRGSLALSAYMLGDRDRALREIRRSGLKNLPLFHAMAAIIFAESGLGAEAVQARAEFMRLRPTFFDNLDVELTKRDLRPEDQAVLIEGARKAGFPIPDRFLKSRKEM